MGLTLNLVEILIRRVHRPHGLLVTLHWISLILWPLIDHTLFVHFRTNLMEIFIGVPQTCLTFGHTSVNFHPILAFDWPYTFYAFWTNLLELSLGDPQIWLIFVHTSLNFHIPLIVWALAAHFRTNCSWNWPPILWKYSLQWSIYLINFWSCFTVFSSNNLALSVHFWTSCSTATCIHRCLVCIRFECDENNELD